MGVEKSEGLISGTRVAEDRNCVIAHGSAATADTKDINGFFKL